MRWYNIKNVLLRITVLYNKWFEVACCGADDSSA